MNLEEKVEKKLIESKLIFRDKKITGEINKELKLIDFKKYSKEPISVEQLLEIDSPLTNIWFGYAKRRGGRRRRNHSYRQVILKDKLKTITDVFS